MISCVIVVTVVRDDDDGVEGINNCNANPHLVHFKYIFRIKTSYDVSLLRGHKYRGACRRK